MFNDEGFNHLLNASIDAIIVINSNGIILEWNQSAEYLLKYKKEEILNHSIFLLIPKEQQKFAQMDFQTFNKTQDSTWKNQIRLLELLDKYQKRILVDILVTPFQQLDKYFFTIILKNRLNTTYQKMMYVKSFSFNQILNQINHNIYISQTKKEFLINVCKDIITIGKYKFAWFGIVKKKPKKKIIPVLQYGKENTILKTILTNINAPIDKYRAKNNYGPIHNTITEKKTTIINSIQLNIKNKQIIDEANKQDLASFISLPILINKSVYGVLNIFSDKENNFNDEEIHFFNQIILEIQLGITILKEQKEKRYKDKKIKLKSLEIQKRLKELNCLYGISKIIEQENLSLKNTLQKIVNIIPSGFQHPKKISCQINYENQSFFSENFKISNCNIIHNIKSRNKIIGTLSIYHKHMDNKKSCYMFFLKEEEHLIEDIKERLSKVIDRYKAENEVGYLTRIFMKLQEKNNIKIASIIHDDLGQSLYALKLKIQNLLNDQISQKEYIDSIDLIDNIIDYARSLSHTVSPIALKSLNFGDAIKELVDTTKELKNIQINLDLKILSNNIKSNWDVNLFRIIQEALHNIVKHANAQKVNITSKKEKNYLIINIIDDGKGFSNDYLEKNKKALGLFLMKERAKILGGTISYHSIKNKGVNIELKIPLSKI